MLGAAQEVALGVSYELDSHKGRCQLSGWYRPLRLDRSDEPAS
jgi:hypothetical protein